MTGKFLHGRPCSLLWSKLFMTRMQTRDLFAVANILVIFGATQSRALSVPL